MQNRNLDGPDVTMMQHTLSPVCLQLLARRPNKLLIGKFQDIDVLKTTMRAVDSLLMNGSRLCYACANGFSHADQTGRCDVCPSMESNQALAILVLFGAFGVTTYVKISMQSAGTFDLADGVQTIGLSFIQILSPCSFSNSMAPNHIVYFSDFPFDHGYSFSISNACTQL